MEMLVEIGFSKIVAETDYSFERYEFIIFSKYQLILLIFRIYKNGNT